MFHHHHHHRRLWPLLHRPPLSPPTRAPQASRSRSQPNKSSPGVKQSPLFRPPHSGARCFLGGVTFSFPVGSRGRYHGSRRPSSDDSFHSPTVIPPSSLDKPSIMKRYHRRRTCSHTSPRRSATMVTLHDTGFVECRWWNDGWTVKTVVT